MGATGPTAHPPVSWNHRAHQFLIRMVPVKSSLWVASFPSSLRWGVVMDERVDTLTITFEREDDIGRHTKSPEAPKSQDTADEGVS